jgi:hypothetical protein
LFNAAATIVQKGEQVMKNIWKWLGNNHGSIQAASAIFAALLAVGTVAMVKWQVDASARLQKEQSARDIYREYLNISISKPEFADPDYCAIKASNQNASYEAYVSYLLYAGEQMLELGDDWNSALDKELAAHAGYLCSSEDWSDFAPPVEAAIARMQSKSCNKVLVCP